MIGSVSSEIGLNKLEILKLVACGEHCLLEGEHSSQKKSYPRKFAGNDLGKLQS